LSAGFPIQYASVAVRSVARRRSPTVSGAAQQLHIIEGRASALPRTPPRTPLPNSRAGHADGSATCTAAASTSPTTSAGQIARK
jgi:hypothetical protein